MHYVKKPSAQCGSASNEGPSRLRRNENRPRRHPNADQGSGEGKGRRRCMDGAFRDFPPHFAC